MAGTARVQRWTTISALALAWPAPAAAATRSRPPRRSRRPSRAGSSGSTRPVARPTRRSPSAAGRSTWSTSTASSSAGSTTPQAAIKSITALRIPEGAGPQPGAFVKELKALGPELDKLSEASEDLEPADAGQGRRGAQAAPGDDREGRRGGRAQRLHEPRRALLRPRRRAGAGVRPAAQQPRPQAPAPDQGPRLRVSANTPGEFAVAFRNYSEIIDSAVYGIDKLDPPQWAAEQVGNYQVALRDLQSVSQKCTAILAGGQGQAADQVDRAKYVRTQKQLNKAARAEPRPAARCCARSARGRR